MNDNELITTLLEQRGKIPMTTPVEQIISRGRAIRARRRVPGVAATAGTAAAAAVAVTMALPANHPADGPSVQLAAWTVTKLAGGNISVTIRELKDPAGLQRTLRADGVPASVTFTSQQNPACRSYPGGTPGQAAGTPLLRRVFPEPYREFRWSPGRPVSRRAVSRRLPPSQNNALIVIHPSALPGNAGVQIASVNGGPDGASGVDMPTVVYASPQCTGG
jgi:hypothetical protein